MDGKNKTEQCRDTYPGSASSFCPGESMADPPASAKVRQEEAPSPGWMHWDLEDGAGRESGSTPGAANDCARGGAGRGTKARVDAVAGSIDLAAEDDAGSEWGGRDSAANGSPVDGNQETGIGGPESEADEGSSSTLITSAVAGRRCRRKEEHAQSLISFGCKEAASRARTRETPKDKRTDSIPSRPTSGVLSASTSWDSLAWSIPPSMCTPCVASATWQGFCLSVTCFDTHLGKKTILGLTLARFLR